MQPSLYSHVKAALPWRQQSSAAPPLSHFKPAPYQQLEGPWVSSYAGGWTLAHGGWRVNRAILHT